jgi:quercetin dioxygenase-like cupin family protein
MKVIEVEKLPGVVPPAHYDLASRRISESSAKTKNMVVGWTRMEPTGRTDPHTHEDIQHIFIVLKGELRVRVKDEDIFLKPGQAIIISPGELHANFNASKGETEYISVTCTLIP